MRYMKSEEADIICFQGMPMRTREERYITIMFKGQIFHAPANTKQKGVLICIQSNVQLKVEKVWRDKEERYIIAQGVLEGKHNINKSVCTQ